MDKILDFMFDSTKSSLTIATFVISAGYLLLSTETMQLLAYTIQFFGCLIIFFTLILYAAKIINSKTLNLTKS